MKIYLSLASLLFATLLLMGFNIFNMPDVYAYQISPAESTVNSLLDKNAKFLSKKYKMRAIVTNVAMPGGVVKLLGLDFQIQGPITKNELRKILINSANDFISTINQNKDIHQYLEHNPFDINAMDITLFLIDSEGDSINHPDIRVASIRDNKLTYKTYITTDIPKLISREEETYEEALKKLQESN
jgi:hypothetical protein